MTSSGKKKLEIEEIYQKKTPVEHILLRPDTYIGSTSLDLQQMWVWDDDSKMIVRKNINFCPGLYKIFDEILVNAADNKQRDPKMSTIKIDIDVVENSISVFNDGKAIPVTMHKEEKMYVPTLIFGHLLTSSNFNDSEKKVTGGRNGYGAKLCNIFSHKFVVETASNEHHKKFTQIWEENMGKTQEPEIVPFKGSDYTRVTFIPDLRRFNMSTIDNDFMSLLKKRAYDIAGTTSGINVYLNGSLIEIRSFEKYAKLYSRADMDEGTQNIKALNQRVNPRWEVCVLPSDGSFQHVSFVNSIATTKGGTHVNHVCNKLVAKLSEDVSKKLKSSKITIRPQHIKQHLWLFINCSIENPCFDSQTKENMTLSEKEFGSSCDFNEKFLKSVSSELIENIVTWYELKTKEELVKKGATVKRSKLIGIKKLEDAPLAGTKRSTECTLILTEGDSAKTIAITGLGVLDRSLYGVFPLRGKFINIRETPMRTVIKNNEVDALLKIIGLDFKKKYDTNELLSTLRYGKVMIMTDQDQDGSHIKGLIINFFHHLWPNLIKGNFLEQFITPIVKVTKKDKSISFYSLPEYEEWKKENPNYQSWNVKYYKGLASSDDEEARQYFNEIDRHRILFSYTGQPCDDSIVLAFSKSKIEARKKWLDNYQIEVARRKDYGLPPLYLYQKNTRNVSYSDFINKELVLFSHSDNVRSIPSLIDGLKPGQRKVLFTMFKKNYTRVKLMTLAGAVTEAAAYHHGDTSLTSTIVGLAQCFVGSNNINIFQPEGQFGSRLKGGQDAGSPRYLFTSLSPLARAIFPKQDDPLLAYIIDDNQYVEPEWYCPIIPMVLVNGAEGIGTGYATKIPNYNPREIVENIKRMIDGFEPVHMIPWYKGFTGTITEINSDKVVTSGRAYFAGQNSIEVSELPIGVWTEKFVDKTLIPLCKSSGNTGKLVINDYRSFCTDTMVRYVLECPPGTLDSLDDAVITQELRLQTTLHTSSMILFDGSGVLHKYMSDVDILKEFYHVRLAKYVQRKEYYLEQLKAECLKLENQARFILEKISGNLLIENKRRTEIISLLKENNFVSDPVKAWQKKVKITLNLPDDPEFAIDPTEDASDEMDFNYLLNLTMWTLSLEKKEALIKLRQEKLNELETLRNTTPQQLWLKDIDVFLKELDKYDEKQIEKNQSKITKKIKKNIKTPVRTREIHCLPSIEAENLKKKNKGKKAQDNSSLGGEVPGRDSSCQVQPPEMSDEDVFNNVERELFRDGADDEVVVIDDSSNDDSNHGPKKVTKKASEKKTAVKKKAEPKPKSEDTKTKPKAKKDPSSTAKRAPKKSEKPAASKPRSTKVGSSKPATNAKKSEKQSPKKSKDASDEDSITLEFSPVKRTVPVRSSKQKAKKYQDSDIEVSKGQKSEESDFFVISDED